MAATIAIMWDSCVAVNHAANYPGTKLDAFKADLKADFAGVKADCGRPFETFLL